MTKKSNGETPFSFTYGMEAVIPAEIGIPTNWSINVNVNSGDNEKNMRINLNIVEEMREIAAILAEKYKRQIKGYYNKKILESTST